jgi:hypothetical protein
MHPSISAFPSKQFYSGKLRDAHRIQVECSNAQTATSDKSISAMSADNGSSAGQKGSTRSRFCRLNSPRHFSPVTLFNIEGREESTGIEWKLTLCFRCWSRYEMSLV